MTLAGHISAADKARSDYAYAPFEVPAGVVRLEARYRVSAPRDAADLRGHGNTIDIGIFDPRSATPRAGFAGKSVRASLGNPVFFG